MSTTNTEILVIGAGVIGDSMAYHLARQGRQVLVVERSEVAKVTVESLTLKPAS